MDELILIGLFILVFVGLPVGVGCLFYFVPKKLGYPKAAKYLAVGYGFLILIFALSMAFEDQFFTKKNAVELVEEQGIKLTDEFDLTENKSTSAIGDYYHTFTLKISERDKQKAITNIKSSENFKSDNRSIENLMLHPVPNRYFGNKVTQNYETENSYVREYFKPSGHEGYAPTFRRISINKANNELTFEDINE
ncbi:hypothetical protein KSK37_12750 [Kaistella sp. DKR-2]|uniref:hypothetical protein n=1 Tax=Kaistella soli TaxID=2849654 RepID=UPI001C273E84|nr:hypothetical protein [Kaistella soli]MBU8883957.1 hypothetical protein [Kaistella soli]